MCHASAFSIVDKWKISVIPTMQIEYEVESKVPKKKRGWREKSARSNHAKTFFFFKC